MNRMPGSPVLPRIPLVARRDPWVTVDAPLTHGIEWPLNALGPAAPYRLRRGAPAAATRVRRVVYQYGSTASRWYRPIVGKPTKRT